MTDISADNFTRVDARAETERDTTVNNFLSALLIIGLPATFWLSVMELVNYCLALGLSADTRLVVAGVLITLLSLIWCFILIAADQRKSWELEAQLSRRQASPI